MKGDRVGIRIAGDKEAAEGAVGKRALDHTAPLCNEVVQRISVGAGDPEHHANTKWPRFGKRVQGLSQRQPDGVGLENDRSRRTVRRGFKTESFDVELAGRNEVAHLQGDEVGAIG
ncbi:hypothetical protein AX768_20900 [Burkholderia sp. PAMC 28687]|nr:hypothetical protein AX768_20900 [Burkholderia sp. PAMC 28687]